MQTVVQQMLSIIYIGMIVYGLQFLSFDLLLKLLAHQNRFFAESLRVQPAFVTPPSFTLCKLTKNFYK